MSRTDKGVMMNTTTRAVLAAATAAAGMLGCGALSDAAHADCAPQQAETFGTVPILGTYVYWGNNNLIGPTESYGANTPKGWVEVDSPQLFPGNGYIAAGGAGHEVQVGPANATQVC